MEHRLLMSGIRGGSANVYVRIYWTSGDTPAKPVDLFNEGFYGLYDSLEYAGEYAGVEEWMMSAVDWRRAKHHGVTLGDPRMVGD